MPSAIAEAGNMNPYVRWKLEKIRTLERISIIYFSGCFEIRCIAVQLRRFASKAQEPCVNSKGLGEVLGIGRMLLPIAFRRMRENLLGESVPCGITGGSAHRRETLNSFNGIGYHLANGYGMTEIGIMSVELSEKNVS